MEDVLILGAGRVGTEIAAALVEDKYGVTIVDTNANTLLAMHKYDLRTVNGNAADEELLIEAGVRNASMVVAVTASDEVNLVACRICESLTDGNVYTISRVRNRQYKPESIRRDFGIDHVFCPEDLVAEAFNSDIAHPGCLSVHHFTDEKLVLAAIRISSKAESAGATIEELRTQINELEYRIVSIYRDGQYMMPAADTRLFVGDEVYVLMPEGNLEEFTPFLAGKQQRNKHIFIAGGGNIGERVAKHFVKKANVKVLELNINRCGALSERLPEALILKGSATDETLLEQEGIDDTDIFCSITNDDEENILSALLAKRMGAKRTAVLINRTAYVGILDRQLDVVISPSIETIGCVLGVIRAGNLNAVHSLRHGNAEAIEFTVHASEDNSKITGREVQEVEWPDGVCLGAILRGSGKTRQMIIVHDNTVIQQNDHLICFVADRTAVMDMKKFIMVGEKHIASQTSAAESAAAD